MATVVSKMQLVKISMEIVDAAKKLRIKKKYKLKKKKMKVLVIWKIADVMEELNNYFDFNYIYFLL